MTQQFNKSAPTDFEDENSRSTATLAAIEQETWGEPAYAIFYHSDFLVHRADLHSRNMSGSHYKNGAVIVSGNPLLGCLKPDSHYK
jgi:hypothetical protein